VRIVLFVLCVMLAGCDQVTKITVAPETTVIVTAPDVTASPAAPAYPAPDASFGIPQPEDPPAPVDCDKPGHGRGGGTGAPGNDKGRGGCDR
jgi:hypothetical protein